MTERPPPADPAVRLYRPASRAGTPVKLAELDLEVLQVLQPQPPEPAPPAAGDAAAPEPVREIGGRREGLEPTRYGDWEKKGRCIDF